jgi:hypothetical protein
MNIQIRKETNALQRASTWQRIEYMLGVQQQQHGIGAPRRGRSPKRPDCPNPPSISTIATNLLPNSWVKFVSWRLSSNLVRFR